MQLPNGILRKQMVGFALTGILSTLLMFGLYVGLNKVINYQYSYLISYSISVVALYFMNIFFVFHRHASVRTFVTYPLIYVAQYLVGAASLELLIHLGFSITYAPLLIVIILLPITFILNRFVLLKNS